MPKVCIGSAWFRSYGQHCTIWHTFVDLVIKLVSVRMQTNSNKICGTIGSYDNVVMKK